MEEKEIKAIIDSLENKLAAGTLQEDEAFWFARYVEVLKDMQEK